MHLKFPWYSRIGVGIATFACWWIAWHLIIVPGLVHLKPSLMPVAALVLTLLIAIGPLAMYGVSLRVSIESKGVTFRRASWRKGRSYPWAALRSVTVYGDGRVWFRMDDKKTYMVLPPKKDWTRIREALDAACNPVSGDG